MELGTTASTYLCKETGEVFILGNVFGSPLLYSPDGSIFYTWFIQKFRDKRARKTHKNTPKAELITINPQTLQKRSLLWMDNFVQYDDKVFLEQEYWSSKVDVYPLPVRQVPIFLGDLTHLDFLLVTKNQFSHSYDSVKIYLGRADWMEPIELLVHKIDVRDGIIHIPSSRGDLFITESLGRANRRIAMFGGSLLTRLNPSRYDLVEQHGIFRVTPK